MANAVRVDRRSAIKTLCVTASKRATLGLTTGNTKLRTGTAGESLLTGESLCLKNREETNVTRKEQPGKLVKALRTTQQTLLVNTFVLTARRYAVRRLAL